MMIDIIDIDMDMDNDRTRTRSLLSLSSHRAVAVGAVVYVRWTTFARISCDNFVANLLQICSNFAAILQQFLYSTKIDFKNLINHSA